MKKNRNYIYTYNIYILINPLNNNVFYVGQTVDLSMREYVHLSYGNIHRDKEIKSILKHGKKPIMKPIETIKSYCYADTLYVFHREIFWIKYYKSIGNNILNRQGVKDNSVCRAYERYKNALKERIFIEDFYVQRTDESGNLVYCLEKIISDGFTPSQKEKLTQVLNNIGVELVGLEK